MLKGAGEPIGIVALAPSDANRPQDRSNAADGDRTLSETFARLAGSQPPASSSRYEAQSFPSDGPAVTVTWVEVDQERLLADLEAEARRLKQRLQS